MNTPSQLRWPACPLSKSDRIGNAMPFTLAQCAVEHDKRKQFHVPFRDNNQLGILHLFWQCQLIDESKSCWATLYFVHSLSTETHLYRPRFQRKRQKNEWVGKEGDEKILWWCNIKLGGEKKVLPNRVSQQVSDQKCTHKEFRNTGPSCDGILAKFSPGLRYPKQERGGLLSGRTGLKVAWGRLHCSNILLMYK